jgi:transposase
MHIVPSSWHGGGIMIQLTFTAEDIAALKKEKHENPFSQVRRRCEVVYLKSQKFKHQDIERIVDLSHTTITNHLRLYQHGGLEALKTVTYVGQPSKLHPYTECIKASLDAQPVGTYKEAKARITELTGIELSLPQIKYFLDQIGCLRRKVKQIPDKLDIEQQETFKQHTLEPLIAEAQKAHLHLLFVDAAHFVLRPFLGFLYCFTPLFVKASAGRQRYNVLGALDAITKQLTIVTNGTYINSHALCALFDQLKTQYTDGLPLYLLLDNARYQKNTFVQTYAKQLGITLVYLPAYSPNLNLIERLWKFVKKTVLYSVYYADFSAFTTAIDRCLSDTQDRYKEELTTLLTLNFQTFKNANIKP